MRLTNLGVVAVCAIAVACTAGPRAAPSRSAPSGRAIAFEATGSPAPPGAHCPTPPRPGPYAPAIRPATARVGAAVQIAGNTPLFNEAGRYVGPGGRIGFWFNLPPHRWEHVYFGGSPPATTRGAPVIHLGEVDVEGACSYRVRFRVPNVPAHTYAITPVEHDRKGSAALESVELRVTR